MARRTLGALLLLSISTAASAQDSDGTLSINSPVDGALVYVDNTLLGNTPYSAELDEGRHTIRVTADGFDPFVREVTIAAGETTTIDAQLYPGSGTVEFISSARGAVVTFADGQQWSLPIRLALRDLPYGDYHYTISAPTYAASEGDFTFSAGQNVFIYAALESNTGRIAIESTPESANVFFDGVEMGTTPLALDDVPPGIYQVRLEQEKHATVFRTLDTTNGDIGEIQARLPERGARLVVQTRDPEAEVRLEGQLIGTGRRVVVPELERRQYTLEASAPESNGALTRIDVPRHGRVLYAVDFEPTGSDTASSIINRPPLHQRWTFWTATGVSTAVAVVGGVLIYNALQPEPVPGGDITITLP